MKNHKGIILTSLLAISAALLLMNNTIHAGEETSQTVPPATEAPVTQPPSTEPPATEAPTTQAPVQTTVGPTEEEISRQSEQASIEQSVIESFEQSVLESYEQSSREAAQSESASIEESKEAEEKAKKEAEEKAKKEAEEKAKREAEARRRNQIIINQRRPSYNPQDYQPVTPVTPPEIVEETQEAEEVVEKPGLLEGDYVIFNASIFDTEAEADDYIKMIEEDEENKDRFIIEKEELNGQFYLVTVEYQEDADKDGQPILFYVGSAFEDEEEAKEYAEFNLLMYPDLFFDAEIIEVEEKYDAIFGIRTNVDTQALTYDEESFFILYTEDRQEFSYIITADENGLFFDQIPEVVNGVFPGEFTFTEEDISETEKRITMTPVPVEETEEETTTATEESENN